MPFGCGGEGGYRGIGVRRLDFDDYYLILAFIGSIALVSLVDGPIVERFDYPRNPWVAWVEIPAMAGFLILALGDVFGLVAPAIVGLKPFRANPSASFFSTVFFRRCLYGSGKMGSPHYRGPIDAEHNRMLSYRLFSSS